MLDNRSPIYVFSTGRLSIMEVLDMKLIIKLCVLLVLLTMAATIPAMACEPPTCNTGKVTGGGWILVCNQQDNPKATFGLVAMSDGSSTKGSSEHNDHFNGVKLKSTEITSLVINGNTATYTGTAKVNGESGFDFTVTVTDNGEPGNAPKGSDTYAISIPDIGYSVEGTLGGGNIQIHK